MKIAILCGGNSSERAVSFESSRNVYQAVKDTYNITLIDTGRGEIFNDFDKQEEKKSLGWNLSLVQRILIILQKKEIDFVIVMLHGHFGEDGHIQALLDMCNIPYTGTNMGSSYLGMNKEISKYLMNYFNIPTPEAIFIDKNYSIDKLKEKLDFPVIVKPISEGSTIGITIVKEKPELKKALDIGFE
jgi:D-alanine-D-alanine ligase